MNAYRVIRQLENSTYRVETLEIASSFKDIPESIRGWKVVSVNGCAETRDVLLHGERLRVLVCSGAILWN